MNRALFASVVLLAGASLIPREVPQAVVPEWVVTEILVPQEMPEEISQSAPEPAVSAEQDCSNGSCGTATRPRTFRLFRR